MRVKMLSGFLCALVSMPFAYTYTAWTGMTGARTIAIAPSLYGGEVNELGNSTLDLNTAFGYGETMDCIVNLSKYSPLNNGTWGGIEVMPRYALTENHILALKLGTTDKVQTVSPQYHAFKSFEKFDIEFNTAIDLSSETDFKEGTVWASAGFVHKTVPEVFHPFVELNPSIDYGFFKTSFTFSIDPGVWIGFKDTPHQFSLSFPLSGIKEDAFTVGLNLWYWWSFEY